MNQSDIILVEVTQWCVATTHRGILVLSKDSISLLKRINGEGTDYSDQLRLQMVHHSGLR